MLERAPRRHRFPLSPGMKSPETPSTAVPAMDSPWVASPATDWLHTATPSVGAGVLPSLSIASPTSSSIQSTPSLTPVKSSSNKSSSSKSSGDSLGWRKGKEIGFGTYGSVFLAQDKVDGHTFAVKVARFDKRDENDNKFCDKLRKELEICKDLRHRNIVSCLGHEVVNSRLYIYLEYVAGGSLRRQLDEFGPVEGPLLRKGTRGLLNGLNYLHTHNPPVVHRDLKGANVLVDLNFCVKLADFGCSKRDVSTQSFTATGSVQWVAPEVLQGNSGHGRKADIWSLGCVVIEMATAADPWGKGAFDNFMQAVRVVGFSDRTPPVPEALPLVGQDLVARCVQRSPNERPWCSELLEHELVHGSSAESRTTSRASRREA